MAQIERGTVSHALKGGIRGNHTWYVEPQDAHTNVVISQELPADSFQRDLPDEDGVLRKVWECSWPLVATLRRNRRQQNLQFLTFVRAGHGKMRSAAFLGKGTRPRARKPSRAA